MELRPLGRTGVKVSSLCLGCMMFGGKTTPDDSYAIIDRAIEQGINFIDTANVYSRGRSEEVTGEALHRNGRREQVILATKGHGGMSPKTPTCGQPRRHIIEQCEASLRRLKTDWIDLYQMHRPQTEIPIDETLRALDDLVRAGKMRYIGSSTFAAWQVVEACFAAKELGTTASSASNRRTTCWTGASSASCCRWPGRTGSRPSRGPARRRPVHRQVPARSGAAGGRPFRHQSNPFYAREQRPPLRSIGGLTTIAEAGRSSRARAGLGARPARRHQPDHRPRTMEQYEENVHALKVAITDDDRKQINRVIRRGDSVAPFSRGDFGPHQYRGRL